MALKHKLASRAEWEGLAEPVRREYVEKDGAFVLDVEGSVVVPAEEHRSFQVKFAEFRDNNKILYEKNKDLQAKADALAKYEGIDPEKYRELEGEVKQFKEKGVGSPEDLQGIIAKEIEKATKPIREKWEAAEAARVKAQKDVEQGKFRELVDAEATKAGVAGSAKRFVLREADSLFEYKDGNIVPKEGVRHPTDPLQDYTPSAWLQQLAKSDAYLFEPSTGSGAPGNGNAQKTQSLSGKILRNPSAEDMGARMDDIIAGKVTVVRD